jgi:hypothetical protein
MVARRTIGSANILAEFIAIPSNTPMITLTRTSLVALFITSSLVSGCSPLSSGKNIREAELPITPTESSVSFSRTAQTDIATLGLTVDQLGDPTGLESDAKVAGISSVAQRSLLISEAWYLRGQNDLEVPLPVSLERFLRATHFAYEAIFGESGCNEPSSQLCKDLSSAYNRAVREVARLTHNGTLSPAPGETRYIVDLEADNDPLTLSEWDLVLSDTPNGSATGSLGAAGTGCQALESETGTGTYTARQCVPLAFLVSFDERVTDDRARAHLAAFNTLERDQIQLHGRTVSLTTDGPGAWSEIFAPGSQTLSCLGNAHPALPTVIFLTPNTQHSYEWPVLGEAITNEPAIRDHYNFCASNVPSSDPATRTNDVDAIHGSLRAVMPGMKDPAQIILIAQGPHGDGVLKGVKSALKSAGPGAPPPLSVAGTLSFPAPAALGANTLPIPISSTKELSRSGAVALGDIKRLLTRLVHEDDGIFGTLTRSSVNPSANERLSPVM